MVSLPRPVNKYCHAATILIPRRLKWFDFAPSLAVKARWGLHSLLSGHSMERFLMFVHRHTTPVLAQRQIQRGICTRQNCLQIHPPSAGKRLIFIYRFAVLEHSLFPLCPQAQESSRCDIFYHRTSSWISYRWQRLPSSGTVLEQCCVFEVTKQCVSVFSQKVWDDIRTFFPDRDRCSWERAIYSSRKGRC